MSFPIICANMRYVDECLRIWPQADGRDIEAYQTLRHDAITASAFLRD